MREHVLFYCKPSENMPAAASFANDPTVKRLLSACMRGDYFKTVLVDDEQTRRHLCQGKITRLPCLAIDSGEGIIRLEGRLKITQHLNHLTGVSTAAAVETPPDDEDDFDDDIDFELPSGPVFDYIRNDKNLVLKHSDVSKYDYVIIKGQDPSWEDGCDPSEYSVIKVTLTTLKTLIPYLTKDGKYLIVSDGNPSQKLLKQFVQALYDFHVSGVSLEEITAKYDLKRNKALLSAFE